MKIFTVRNGEISEGAEILRYKAGDGIEFDAIVVGAQGRGNRLAALPVAEGLPVVNQKESRLDQAVRKLMSADVGATRSGRPKLVAETTVTAEACIVVFATTSGFRGSHSLKGECIRPGSDPAFADLPGAVRVLAEGYVQGAMTTGANRVVVLPANVVVAETRSGRLYGQPGIHYVLFDGAKLHARSGAARDAAEDSVFPPRPATGPTTAEIKALAAQAAAQVVELRETFSLVTATAEMAWFGHAARAAQVARSAAELTEALLRGLRGRELDGYRRPVLGDLAAMQKTVAERLDDAGADDEQRAAAPAEARTSADEAAISAATKAADLAEVAFAGAAPILSADTFDAAREALAEAARAGELAMLAANAEPTV